MFQVMKELYIQVTDPSAPIISRAVQNQRECYNDVHGLHEVALPENPLCGAESVQKADDFATTRCNELAVAIHHILQGMNLKMCAFMARALISRRNSINGQFSLYDYGNWICEWRGKWVTTVQEQCSIRASRRALRQDPLRLSYSALVVASGFFCLKALEKYEEKHVLCAWAVVITLHTQKRRKRHSLRRI